MKKLAFDAKKGAQAMADLLQKGTDASKKAVEKVQEGTRTLAEKAKSDSYERRLKKFNPLFPEQYFSELFHLPNMIVIADDAVRRGVDVCEGAIGWLSKDGGMEVLHLYDEAVEQSGITFVPAVTCDAVYYVDSFDRKTFIRIDQLFAKAHEERLAELKHIAYALGAKSCTIEISEMDHEVTVAKKSGEAGKGFLGFSSTEKIERKTAVSAERQRSGKIVAEFAGSDQPKRPTLKWFAHDDTVKRLIEMRCEQGNAIKSEVLELHGSTTAAMSQKTATAIDETVGKLGVKGGMTMESQAKKENQTKLIFSIYF